MGFGLQSGSSAHGFCVGWASTEPDPDPTGPIGISAGSHFLGTDSPFHRSGFCVCFMSRNLVSGYLEILVLVGREERAEPLNKPPMRPVPPTWARDRMAGSGDLLRECMLSKASNVHALSKKCH